MGFQPRVPCLGHDDVVTRPSISLLQGLDRTTYQAICDLLPQLTTSSPLPTYERLCEVVEAPSNNVFVARSGDQLLGMLTLIVVPLPTGRVAHIEQVVVDERSRGMGVGRSLAEAALAAAKSSGARHVDLTSRPSREAANSFYQSLGFTPRETNVWRYQFNVT